MSLEDKVMRFKELVKRGYSVNKGLKEVGLSKRQYLKHYDGIWGDPEMAQFRPKPPAAKRPLEQKTSQTSGTEEERPPEMETEFEKQWDKIEREKAAILRAAMKITGVQEGSVHPAESPFKEIEKAVEGRERIKQFFEKMGFKVEDQYLRRDEVERIVEEAKRRAAEEALEEKQIEAVKEIVKDAVSKVIEMFKPAVNMIFVPPPKKEAPPEGATEQETGSSTSQAS